MKFREINGEIWEFLLEKNVPRVKIVRGIIEKPTISPGDPSL